MFSCAWFECYVVLYANKSWDVFHKQRFTCCLSSSLFFWLDFLMNCKFKTKIDICYFNEVISFCEVVYGVISLWIVLYWFNMFFSRCWYQNLLFVFFFTFLFASFCTTCLLLSSSRFFLGYAGTYPNVLEHSFISGWEFIVNCNTVMSLLKIKINKKTYTFYPFYTYRAKHGGDVQLFTCDQYFNHICTI